MNNSQWITIVLITAVLMLVFLIFNNRYVSMPKAPIPEKEMPMTPADTNK